MSRYRQTMSEALRQVREEDHEISMARGELEAIADKALKLSSMLKSKTDSDNLEAWVQSKITKAKDYVNSVADYLEYNPDMNEKFTMKQYKKNEDDNEHSLNALELVKAFGTPADKKEMQGIYDRHMKRGHISGTDYNRRNQLHNKYIGKLKEEVEMLPEMFSDTHIKALQRAYAPLKGKRISTTQAHQLMGILDKFDTNKSALEKLAKAGIPFVSDLAVSRLISKHKYRADQLKNLKEEDNETERLKQELERKDDQISLLKQKAEKDKAKATQAATQKMVNPETGEPLLQVGIAYKHLKDKLAKEKASEDDLKQKEKENKRKMVQKFRDRILKNEENELTESEASDQAKSMGLTYMKFGRYGKDGKVTHKTSGNSLVKVDKDGNEVEDKPKSDEPQKDTSKDTPSKEPKLDPFDVKKDLSDLVTDGMIDVETTEQGGLYMQKEYEPSQDYEAEKDVGAIEKYLKSKGVDVDRDVMIEIDNDDGEDGYIQIHVEYRPGKTMKPEQVKEMAKDDAYAIGMAAAKKKYNDEPPLDKKTIKKGHEIADKIMKKEFKTLRAEGKMSDIDALQKQGKGAEEIAKLMKLPVKTIKQILGEYSGYVDIRGRLSNTQLDNIKKTWAKKSYKDVTKGLRDMMKNMDPGSKAAIRSKGINVLSKLVDEQKETIKEFKKMTVTIAPPLARDQAIRRLKKVGLTVSNEVGKTFKVDGKGADLNKYATDLKNFYGATIKAESAMVEGTMKGGIVKYSGQSSGEHMKAKKALKDFMSKPQPAKGADDKVMAFIFDDELLDDLYVASQKKMSDVRPIVKKRLKALGIKENSEHPAKEVYESIEAVKNKAKKTGMPYSILKKVYDRGMAAWRGGHRPGATQVQWALARVNSFVTKSSGTWGGADKDLAKQVRGK